MNLDKLANLLSEDIRTNNGLVIEQDTGMYDRVEFGGFKYVTTSMNPDGSRILLNKWNLEQAGRILPDGTVEITGQSTMRTGGKEISPYKICPNCLKKVIPPKDPSITGGGFQCPECKYSWGKKCKAWITSYTDRKGIVVKKQWRPADEKRARDYVRALQKYGLSAKIRPIYMKSIDTPMAGQVITPGEKKAYEKANKIETSEEPEELE